MALLNYSTSIDVNKTLGEIQKKIVEHGARKIMYNYDTDGHIDALCFTVVTPNGERGIRLPANVPAIYDVMKQQKRSGKIKTKIDYSQAERVAWRIVKDWVDAQMAILESQMVEFEEVFLPYIVGNGGKTYFQAYQNNQLMLSE